MLQLSLRTKIILVGAIPFLLYTISAGISICQSYSAYSRAETNLINADRILRMSAFIHELQKERGKSNSFLNGALAYSEIHEQISLTDQKAGALTGDQSWTPEMQKSLETLRQSVNSKKIAPAQAVLEYRGYITQLMNSEIALVNLSRGTPVESEMVNVLILERAKESAGRLRANMTGILAAKTPITEEQLTQLIASKSGVDSNLDSPALHVSGGVNDGIKKFDQIAEWKEVVRTFNAVVRNSKEGGYGTDPLFFFGQATAAIDRLADFVALQVQEVKHIAGNRRSEMLRNCTINVILAISMAVVVCFAIGFTVLSTTKPIVRVVEDLNQGSEHLSNSSNELKDASTKIAEAATESAASIQETSSAIEEISSMIAKNSENAQRVKQASEASRDQAMNGKQVMQEMLSAIDVIKGTQDHVRSEVDDTNKRIRNIVDMISEIKNKTQVINEIVFQTKLLSFNASVEAARAGEHGKGFSVVAEEIGQLADMSGQAAHDISTLLDKSTQDVVNIIEESTSKTNGLIEDAAEKVTAGLSISKRLLTVFDQIVEGVNSMTSMISEISVATQEQSAGVEQVAAAMTELDQANQQNASASTQAAQSATALANEVVRLEEVVQTLRRTVFAEKAIEHDNNSSNLEEAHLQSA